jgi:hypothetical protein
VLAVSDSLQNANVTFTRRKVRTSEQRVDARHGSRRQQGERERERERGREGERERERGAGISKGEKK